MRYSKLKPEIRLKKPVQVNLTQKLSKPDFGILSEYLLFKNHHLTLILGVFEQTTRFENFIDKVPIRSVLGTSYD